MMNAIPGAIRWAIAALIVYLTYEWLKRQNRNAALAFAVLVILSVAMYHRRRLFSEFRKLG